MKKYNCICCNYSTDRKEYIDKHVTTEKHLKKFDLQCINDADACIKKNNIKKQKNKELHNTEDHYKPNSYTCETCKISYKSYSGLWKHKQTCKIDNDNDTVYTETQADTEYYNDDDNEQDIDDTTTINDNMYNDTPESLSQYKSNTLPANIDPPKPPSDQDNTMPSMAMVMRIAEMFIEHQQKMGNTQMETQKQFVESQKHFTETQKQINEKQFENQLQVNEQIVTAITELKNTAMELKNVAPSLASNITNNNTNNTNSHNNLTQNNIQNINDIKFNMNMYLHQYCKNAINVSEFFDNIMANINEKTYELLGRKGFIQGVTELILEELRKYKDYERPFHCVDYRRDTMMVKNNNKWFRDACKVIGRVTTSVIGKCIFDICERNKKNVGEKDLREQEKYGVASCREKDIEIIRHAIGHYKNKNIEKVITNIAKQTLIDKQGYVEMLKEKYRNNELNTMLQYDDTYNDYSM